MENSETFQSEERQEKAEQNMFDIAFSHDGKEYKGWAKRSGNGWHVVLDGVFFGDLTQVNGEWSTNSQREHDLVEKVGKQLESL